MFSNSEKIEKIAFVVTYTLIVGDHKYSVEKSFIPSIIDVEDAHCMIALDNAAYADDPSKKSKMSLSHKIGQMIVRRFAANKELCQQLIRKQEIECALNRATREPKQLILPGIEL